MRVPEIGSGGDLAEEAFGADRGGEFGLEHLYGHLTIVLDVMREVDGGHAALTELTLDAVAVGQCGGEALTRVRHRGAPLPDTTFKITLMERDECSDDGILMRNRCPSGATAYGRPP